MSRVEHRSISKYAVLLIVVVLMGAISSLQPATNLRRSGPTLTPERRVVSADRAVEIAVNRTIVAREDITIEHTRHKVVFDSDGVLFLPRRGPAWQYELTELSVDGHSFEGAAVKPVRPVEVQDGVIEYRRGVVTERYVARRHAVEQQFSILAPPERPGDIVISGNIQSEGEFSKRGEGWVWADDDGVASLGDVTVIDSAGLRLTATMEVTAGSAAIHIPGEQLGRASYPVLVDPEIGTNDFRISDTGPDGDPSARSFNSNPGVSYNPVDNEYLVVWASAEIGDGGAETEIYGQRIDAATGAQIGANDFRISDMGPDGDPGFAALISRVVYNTVEHEYLVVWTGDDDTGSLVADEFEVFGQRLDASSGSEVGSNDVRISDLGPDGDPAYDVTNLFLAYNSSENEYLVVFSGDDDAGDLVDEEREIFGQRLDGATGAEIGANDFRISDMGPDGDPAFRASTPSAAFNTAANEYLVVWAGDDNTGSLVDNEFEIFGQRLNAVGAEIGNNDFRISDMGPDADPEYFGGDPEVAYSSVSDTYFVAWVGDDGAPLANDEREIYGQALAVNGAEIYENDIRVSDMGPDGDTSFGIPVGILGITYNSTADEFLIAWKGADDSGELVAGESEVFAQRISATGGVPVGANDFRISDMGSDGDATFGILIGPSIAYNAMNDEYLVVWSADDDAGLLVDQEFEIYGQRLTGTLGAYVLDGFGGVHPAGGSAGVANATPYFGFDIARDVELATVGYYVLDGFGGLHAGGGADLMAPAPPYFGFNIAVDLELASSGAYVLDGLGGVHAAGAADPISAPTPYFGFNVAVDVELGNGGIYVLDAYGGFHAGNGAPTLPFPTPYFGFNIARDAELTLGTGYLVLDGFGGVHPGGGAQGPNPATPYFGSDLARDLELASGGGVLVLDQFGGTHAGGGMAPLFPQPPYFGFNVARALELQ